MESLKTSFWPICPGFATVSVFLVKLNVLWSRAVCRRLYALATLEEWVHCIHIWNIKRSFFFFRDSNQAFQAEHYTKKRLKSYLKHSKSKNIILYIKDNCIIDLKLKCKKIVLFSENVCDIWNDLKLMALKLLKFWECHLVWYFISALRNVFISNVTKSKYLLGPLYI